MGMETLNSAARAAGFAMAASDEPYEEVKTEVKVADWRPSEAVTLTKLGPAHPHKSGEWFRTMLSLLGLRAPASPA